MKCAHPDCSHEIIAEQSFCAMHFMRLHPLVYISGPITPLGGHSVAENIQQGVDALMALTRMGIPAISPHATAAHGDAFSMPYELWMAYDFAMIRRCTHLLMLPRWETSSGCQREVRYAYDLGLPIAYNVPSLLTLVGLT